MSCIGNYDENIDLSHIYLAVKGYKSQEISEFCVVQGVIHSILPEKNMMFTTTPVEFHQINPVTEKKLLRNQVHETVFINRMLD